jgi:hypothetical protein
MSITDENAGLERSQVTVLFADLAGFTAFCERAGEEAAWNRITLAEIYLEILTAREHPPMRIIVKNFWTFLASMLFGARRAEELLEKAAAHEQLHERGALRARINMDLGLLYKLKRQPGRARTFLEIALVPAELQGAISLVGKIDAALAELP